MQRKFLATVALAIVVSSGSLVEASILGAADGHSLFVFDDFSLTGGSTSARTSVGGDLSSGVFLGGNVVVGGNYTATGSSINGTLTVGGSVNVPVGYFVSGGTFGGSPTDFAAAQADLSGKSAFWGSLAQNGTVNTVGSNLELVGSAPNTTYVFNVSGATWSSATQRKIDVPSTSTALINITGTSVTQNNGLFLAGGIGQNNIVYNFFQATSLQIGNFTPGFVLAPSANLNLNGGSFTNTVIGNSGSSGVFLGGGANFAGSLPGVPPAVPELSSSIIWLVGLLLTTVVRRRGQLDS